MILACSAAGGWSWASWRIRPATPAARRHWGDAYLIHYFPEPGRWVAQRRDSHAMMSARSADGLLDLMRADYAARPVSRHIAGACRPPADAGLPVPARGLKERAATRPGAAAPWPSWPLT